MDKQGSNRSQVSGLFGRRAGSANPVAAVPARAPPIAPRRNTILSIDRNSIRRAVTRLIPSTASRSRSIDNSRFSRGIPVREALQSVYKVHRDKVIKEGVLFLAWFGVLVALTTYVNDVSTAYAAGSAVINLVRDQEMRQLSYYDKTMTNVS
jgi:hypothetical protein